MKAVVLAAGKGTRLRPLTDDKPKVLVEVADRPLLDHVFDQLVDLGVSVSLSSSATGRSRSSSGTRTPTGMSRSRTPTSVSSFGLAHALLQVEPYIDENFLLMLGDNVFRGNLGDILTRQKQEGVDAAFLVEEVPLSEASRYGVCRTNERARLWRSSRNPRTRPRTS